uniref:MHC class II beta chain N-terminal domain-containing protein n=1 Tax=Laticauda laticaudata TaxID=8630 RepID=A0A8C5SN80_LATLA
PLYFLLLLFLLIAHFLAQWKDECRFLNRTEQVQFLFRFFYDQQEIVSFDSELREFVAIMEFGKVVADGWNRDELILQHRKAEVDSFCLHKKVSQSRF